MKKFPFLFVLCLLASCTAPDASAPTSTGLAPTEALPSLPPANTAEPTRTPLPPGTVEYYRVRLEYLTTSDWSTLDLFTTENVLAIKTIETIGEPENLSAGAGRLALNQPLAESATGTIVGVIVDYALAPEALDQALEFHSQKGDIGHSTIGIFSIAGETPELIQAIEHAGVVADSGGMNPKSFTVDLSGLKGTPPLNGRIDRGTRQKMVWAFYYPWYSMDSWTFWLKDHPLVWYESANREVILRHVEQAQGAGIDGFISSWWGPASDTDVNLRKLLDIAQEKDFKVSIYFETLAGPGETPLDETRLREWLAYAIRQYRDHPAFMTVDGKPLIVLWASAEVPLETWEGVIASLRTDGLDAVYLGMGYNPGGLDVFNGLHDYGVFTYPDLEQTYLSTARAVRCYSLLSDPSDRKIWAATVQPGYDDTLQPAREGLVQERLDGGYYRFTWDAALQSDPDWIFITTWNEWWEHTHIEPGELYGDQYLLITREYADLWKNK